MTGPGLPELTEHERGVLQLVRDGGEQASWYWLAKRVPLRGLPLVPDVMTVLAGLRERGLVADRELGNGMDRWWLTPEGEAALGGAANPREAARAAGPLQRRELAALIEALRKDVLTTMRAVKPLAADSVRLWQALRQAVEADEATALNAATAAVMLRDAERGPFVRELAGDPRPAVRAAVFDAFAPPQVETAGEAVRFLPSDELDALLRSGLGDRDRGVRTVAAKLAFASGRGGALVPELTLQLDAPERALRWWSILALGSARDPMSGELLAQILGEADDMMAQAAVRALAARPDGQHAWLAALDDRRPAIADAAIFALGKVASGVAPERLQALRSDARPHVRDAVIAYLRRHP
ncbi:MAG TPA: hypothetical protein VLM79_04565 [Kofleriaceae bacterium]|nr:hypothetical protein [Kofleriaceae bacterium]